MEIKLIENLSNDEYHNGDKYKEYWSSSNIKNYLTSPKEAYYQKFIAASKSSDAFTFGNQFHDFMSSKHIKGQPFPWNIFQEPVNTSTGEPYGKTTKVYKDYLSKIENPISSNDMELITDIWDMMKRSGYCWFIKKEVLSKGLAEPSMLIDGLHKYKYRTDVVTDKYIFDYKTVDKRSWNLRALSYRITDFAYDISAAMYQYFEHRRTGIWKPFLIIWIMKEPPFDILITDISEYCYEKIGDNEAMANSGANVFLKLKDQHEACEASKNWPGISNQFDEFAGVRIPKLSPLFDRGYSEFEIETNEF